MNLQKQAEIGVAIPSLSKVRTHKGPDGEDLINSEDMDLLICARIAKLVKETNPAVKAAEDARLTIDTLLTGVGEEIKKFDDATKHYIESVRQTRFAVVSETAQMIEPLKEVRQFFLGNDYKDQIAHLREFVDLCERLNALKMSGFLDSVAETMLRLDSKVT